VGLAQVSKDDAETSVRKTRCQEGARGALRNPVNKGPGQSDKLKVGGGWVEG